MYVQYSIQLLAAVWFVRSLPGEGQVARLREGLCEGAVPDGPHVPEREIAAAQLRSGHAVAETGMQARLPCEGHGLQLVRDERVVLDGVDRSAEDE